MLKFEPSHEKKSICLCENKDAVTAQLISVFVFATQTVQSIFFLNPKFRVSSLLLGLYRPVGVGPGRKLKLLVFSRRGSFYIPSGGMGTVMTSPA